MQQVFRSTVFSGPPDDLVGHGNFVGIWLKWWYIARYLLQVAILSVSESVIPDSLSGSPKNQLKA
jgi:hypothetical protein